MNEKIEVIDDIKINMSRRRTLKQTLALALFSSAVSFGGLGAAAAETATKRKAIGEKPKFTPDQFLAEFDKAAREGFKKHAGDPTPEPGRPAPEWLHTLLDAVWEYLF